MSCDDPNCLYKRRYPPREQQTYCAYPCAHRSCQEARAKAAIKRVAEAPARISMTDEVERIRNTVSRMRKSGPYQPPHYRVDEYSMGQIEYAFNTLQAQLEEALSVNHKLSSSISAHSAQAERLQAEIVKLKQDLKAEQTYSANMEECNKLVEDGLWRTIGELEEQIRKLSAP